MRYFRWGVPLFLVGLCFVLWRSLAPKEESIAILPIVSWDLKRPLIELKINGYSYKALFDLGSKLEISLFEGEIKKLSLQNKGFSNFKDFRGNQYERPAFLAEKVEIGPIVYKQVKIVSESLRDKAKTIISSEKDTEATPLNNRAKIGRGILARQNILMDMASSKIIIGVSEKSLRPMGYDIGSFVKVPFSLDPKGIFLDIESDLGLSKFLLDTGATVTIVRKSLLPSNRHDTRVRYGMSTIETGVRMQGIDFQKQDFQIKQH